MERLLSGDLLAAWNLLVGAHGAGYWCCVWLLWLTIEVWLAAFVSSNVFICEVDFGDDALLFASRRQCLGSSSFLLLVSVKVWVFSCTRLNLSTGLVFLHDVWDSWLGGATRSVWIGARRIFDAGDVAHVVAWIHCIHHLMMIDNNSCFIRLFASSWASVEPCCQLLLSDEVGDLDLVGLFLLLLFNTSRKVASRHQVQIV